MQMASGVLLVVMPKDDRKYLDNKGDIVRVGPWERISQMGPASLALCCLSVVIVAWSGCTGLGYGLVADFFTLPLVTLPVAFAKNTIEKYCRDQWEFQKARLQKQTRRSEDTVCSSASQSKTCKKRLQRSLSRLHLSAHLTPNIS